VTFREAPAPHCSRCCPTNPLPDTDVEPPRPAETYAQACRDEEPLLGLDATRRLPTLCVLPKGHYGDHDNGAGTTWRYDSNPRPPAQSVRRTRPLSSLAPTVAVHRTRPSSYAGWASEQPDEPAKVRRQRLVAEALGYSAEVQPPNEGPRTEYVTDRWGQATRARLLDVVEAEVAAARTAAGSEARVAGYADGYYAALQDAREKVREAAEKALTDLLDAAPPLHPEP
jgi:hypothetical protein